MLIKKVKSWWQRQKNCSGEKRVCVCFMRAGKVRGVLSHLPFTSCGTLTRTAFSVLSSETAKIAKENVSPPKKGLTQQSNFHQSLQKGRRVWVKKKLIIKKIRAKPHKKEKEKRERGALLGSRQRTQRWGRQESWWMRKSGFQLHKSNCFYLESRVMKLISLWGMNPLESQIIAQRLR